MKKHIKIFFAKMLLIGLIFNLISPLFNVGNARYISGEYYTTNNSINTATGISNFTIPYELAGEENIVDTNSLSFNLNLANIYSGAVLYLDYCSGDCSEGETASGELLYTGGLLDFSNSYFSGTVDGTSTGFLVNYENLIDGNYHLGIIPGTGSTIEEYMTGSIGDKVIDYDFIVDTKPQILSLSGSNELTYTGTNYQAILELKNTSTGDIIFYDFGVWGDENLSQTGEIVLDSDYTNYNLNIDFGNKFENYTGTGLQLHVDIRNSNQDRTILNTWEQNRDVSFIANNDFNISIEKISTNCNEDQFTITGVVDTNEIEFCLSGNILEQYRKDDGDFYNLYYIDGDGNYIPLGSGSYLNNYYYDSNNNKVYTNTGKIGERDSDKLLGNLPITLSGADIIVGINHNGNEILSEPFHIDFDQSIPKLDFFTRISPNEVSLKGIKLLFGSGAGTHLYNLSTNKRLLGNNLKYFIDGEQATFSGTEFGGCISNGKLTYGAYGENAIEAIAMYEQTSQCQSGKLFENFTDGESHTITIGGKDELGRDLQSFDINYEFDAELGEGELDIGPLDSSSSGEYIVNNFIDTTSTGFLLDHSKIYSVYDCLTDENCQNYTGNLLISNNEFSNIVDGRIGDYVYGPSWLDVDSGTDTGSVDTTASGNIDYTSTGNILLFVDENGNGYKYKVIAIEPNWQDNGDKNEFVVDTMFEGYPLDEYIYINTGTIDIINSNTITISGALDFKLSDSWEVKDTKGPPSDYFFTEVGNDTELARIPYQAIYTGETISLGTESLSGKTIQIWGDFSSVGCENTETGACSNVKLILSGNGFSTGTFTFPGEVYVKPMLTLANGEQEIHSDDTTYEMNYVFTGTVSDGDYVLLKVSDGTNSVLASGSLVAGIYTGSLTANLGNTFENYTGTGLYVSLSLLDENENLIDSKEETVKFIKIDNVNIKLNGIQKFGTCKNLENYIKTPLDEFSPFDLSGSVLPDGVEIGNYGGLDFNRGAYYKVYINGTEVYSGTSITNECYGIVTPELGTGAFDGINNGDEVKFKVGIIDSSGVEHESNEITYVVDNEKPQLEVSYLVNDDDFTLSATGSDNYGINQYYWFVEYDDLSREINDYNRIPTWNDHFLGTGSSINVSNTGTYAIVTDDLAGNISYKVFEVKKENKIVSADPEVDLTDTDKAVTTQDIIISTGSIKVELPAGLEIVKDGTGTFDATNIIVEPKTNVEGLTQEEILKGALEFGFGGDVSVQFSKPVKIEIPVSGLDDGEIYIKAKHGGTDYFTTRGLTNNSNAQCIDGDTNEHSDKAIVRNGVAVIYTCSASEFVAFDVSEPAPVVRHSSGGGGGGSSYIPTCKQEQLICKKSGNTFKWYRKDLVRCKGGNLGKICSLEENNIKNIKVLDIKTTKKYQPKDANILKLATKLDKIITLKKRENDTNLLKIRNDILEKIDYLFLNKKSLSKEEKIKLIKELKILIKDFKNVLKTKKIKKLDKYQPKDKKILKLAIKLDKIITLKKKENDINLVKIRNDILEKIDYLFLNKKSLTAADKKALIKELKTLIKDFKNALKNSN